MASSTIFWVFGMTQHGIEPQSPRPLANMLLIRPMAGNIQYSLENGLINTQYSSHNAKNGCIAWEGKMGLPSTTKKKHLPL